ncbi:unnamed protein product, partial [Rotaria sordida]
YSVRTNTVIIQSPKQNSFEKLSTQYPTTLSCPCTQSSIRYDQFLSFDTIYHPICTSQFVNQTFISSLIEYNMSDYYPLDYRIMAASHFQIIALLCQTVKQMVSDALEEFTTKYIITNKALFNDIFNVQIEALIEQLKATTMANIKHINDFLWFNIFQNRIVSGLRTNYYIDTVPGSAVSIFLMSGYTNENKTCTCTLSDNCVHQAGIYNLTGRVGLQIPLLFGSLANDAPLLLTIPGIMVGCLPYNSILASKLECFYNQSCIDQIQIFMKGFSLVKPLSSSHFEKNTTVNDLFHQLFIESWNRMINFTGYFHICYPNSCTYSYNRRFNLFYIIVTIISLFGDLKTILYFSTLILVIFIRRIQNCKNVQNTNDEHSIMNQTNERNQNFKQWFSFHISKIYQKYLTLNMFPLLSDIIDGIYSTRIFILSLIIGVLVLVFYSSLTVYIRINSVYQPSMNEYEQLYKQYSSTLTCPCTRLSVSY